MSQPALVAVDDDDDEFFSDDEATTPPQAAAPPPPPPPPPPPAAQPESAPTSSETHAEPAPAPAPGPATQASEPGPPRDNGGDSTEPGAADAATPPAAQQQQQQTAQQRQTPPPAAQSDTAHEQQPITASPSGKERPPMDFSFEPMQDVLEQEEKTYRRPKAKPMSRATLARLSAPRSKTVPKGKAAKPAAEQPPPADDDGWGTWADAVDVPEEPAVRTQAAAAPRSPSPTKPAPKGKPALQKVTALSLDRYYVCIQGAGVEVGFCVDRKTLLASALEAVGFPLGGYLVYRGLPVHAHATAATLGLKMGPEKVSLLLYCSATEADEQHERYALEAEERASRGHAVAGLAALLVPGRHGRNLYDDAEGDFEEIDD